MISVVFPCLNESERIVPTVERASEFLRLRALAWEIVVVDDGSSDGTGELVRRRFGGNGPVRVVRHETNHGKGWAVREGVRASRGELVLFSDADLSTPIEELAEFESKAAEGYDLVVASRVIPGARILTPQPLGRRLAGAAFRLFVRRLGLSSIYDTQCGFKLMRRSTVGPVFDRVESIGFAFDVELLGRCERAGLRVIELPVDWRDVGGSKVRLYPDALRMARDLLRIRGLLRHSHSISLT
jgi:dolichyl-phosphate beta-glucosyltransferase